MRDELSELLEVLDDREREIIFKRFGLDGGKPKTLEEVGKKFGVTRERIRQLQNIALAKLRRALAKREKPIVGRTLFNSSNRSLQMVPGRVLAWSKLIYRLKLVRICSSLQDKMCSTLCPPHLLSLQQSFDATVITDQSTGRSRAFGFVTLNNAAEVLERPRTRP
jgi:hypothetical protein